MEYSCVSYKIQNEDVLGMTYYMRVSERRRLYEDTWKGRQRINVSGKENIERRYAGRESYIYVLL